jgi:hypothetical protein
MPLDKALRRLAAGAKAFLTLICTVHAPASSSAGSSAPALGRESLSGRKVRRPTWLRIKRTSGLVRLMSDGGTTR